jgi:hypothetical protein
MRKHFFFFGILFCLGACNAPRAIVSNPQPMRAIDLFKQYITGDFNNAAQVQAEAASGKQLHPLAIHVNRVADHRILGAPEIDGFWILEESYYTYPQQETSLKPYLFRFEALGDTAVLLTPYTIPNEIPPADIRNDNPDFRLHFSKIAPSPSFKPAAYTLRDNKFYLHAVNELPGGMSFSLIETISADRLEVMELLERNGQRLTPYDSPIIYDRLK